MFRHLSNLYNRGYAIVGNPEKSNPNLVQNFSGNTESILRKLSELRGCRLEVFCKKGVLGNFAKFTWKHQCQSLVFNKVAGLRPVTLLKKKRWHMRFPLNFSKFLKTHFFIEHLWWLLLWVVKEIWPFPFS